MYHPKSGINRSWIILAGAAIAVLVVSAILVATNLPAVLTTTAEEIAPANDNASVSAPTYHTYDVGAGWMLTTDELGTRLIAPSSPSRLFGASKTLDIGAGYSLVLDTNGGHIVSPARPSTDVKRLDVGAGYVLETSAYGGRLIPPAASVRPAPVTKVLDLGAGYTLVLTPNGGYIVPPSSPAKAQASGTQKFDLGGGYWVEIAPDGRQTIFH